MDPNLRPGQGQPSDVLGDPSAIITDPLANEGHFDVAAEFRKFGYYPTQAEVDSFKPAFGGRNDMLEIGDSAVSQYVIHKKAEADRLKNDPLKALQEKMTESADLQKKQVDGLYTQMQDVLKSAPDLFGNLKPEQINDYLAPLQTSFKQQMAEVQGAIASRGLAASSTENAALAQTGEQFQEKVLSTGLDVGMQSQKNRAGAMGDQIRNLLGIAGTEEQIAGGAAGQRSAQNLGQSNLIASLPFFLNQAAQQQQLIQKQLNSGGGFMDTFNKVTSGINTGMNALQSLAMIPNQFKTASGANGMSGTSGGGSAPYASAGAPNLPGGGSQFMPSAESLAPAGPDAALFAMA